MENFTQTIYIIAEVDSIKGKYWHELTADTLEANFGVISWLSPEAFCYYLPSFLSVGIKENEPNLIVNDAIIGMLDRTVMKPCRWDSFFYERWMLLDTKECYAVQQWVFWLASFNNREMTNISDDALMNALVILDVLAANKL